MSYDEPTRVMRSAGEHGTGPASGQRPPDPRQIGRLRLIIAGLAAVIVGLVIALLAGAGSGGETTTVTETVGAEATEPAATVPTGTTEQTTPETTTDSGGVSPEVDEETGGDETTPEADGGVLPDPDLGEDTTEPSGGISPEG